VSAVSGVKADGSNTEYLLRRKVEAIRASEGAVVLTADGPGRPDPILVGRRAGRDAMAVELHGSSIDDRAPLVWLNRKRAELRESVGGLAAAGVGAAAQDCCSWAARTCRSRGRIANSR
jgi:hypothetical protein